MYQIRLSPIGRLLLQLLLEVSRMKSSQSKLRIIDPKTGDESLKVGSTTAGTSSQVSDGAEVLLCRRDYLFLVYSGCIISNSFMTPLS
ncbi:hypothetical protein L1987_53942 [Smallanthus sonchifolius]|uniref:Uncharacterized protein n=1 Tax=Smallanthus sonchifolius TaxID=185202 RepID=A0ACB9E5A6_9ASTR|nr:hypothetical protein L1987_53942 [Smallanthus sonchifolius]